MEELEDVEVSMPPSSTAYKNKIHPIDKPSKEDRSHEPQTQSDDKAISANGTTKDLTITANGNTQDKNGTANGMAKDKDDISNGTAFENDGLATLKKPTDLSIATFVVTALFNHVCGIFAYHFTVSAKHNWNLKNYKKAHQHARYAAILIIMGILLGLVTYTVALSSYLAVKKDTFCSTAPSSLNGSKTTNTTHSTNTTDVSTTIIPTTELSTNTTTTPTTTTQAPAKPLCCRKCRETSGDTRTCRTFCSSFTTDPIYTNEEEQYEDCCIIITNC